jgi:hypothetical protein
MKTTIELYSQYSNFSMTEHQGFRSQRTMINLPEIQIPANCPAKEFSVLKDLVNQYSWNR